jgi:PPOX class probable F420-dependent enzyme
MRFRSLENRVYRALRDPRASTAAQREIVPWQADRLRDAGYCLVTSYRADGSPVGTPMWFGTGDDRVYLRSEARDAKVRRIARNPEVLVAPCTVRGRPTGPAMRGHARILTTPTDVDRAERMLRANYGLQRRLYGVARAPWLDAAYIEIGRAP